MKQTAVEYAFERLYKMGIIEYIDDPLVQQILNESKAMEQAQSMAIRDKLERIDDGLSWLEDFCHGRVGERVSKMRSLVEDSLKTLTEEPTK